MRKIKIDDRLTAIEPSTNGAARRQKAINGIYCDRTEEEYIQLFDEMYVTASNLDDPETASFTAICIEHGISPSSAIEAAGKYPTCGRIYSDIKYALQAKLTKYGLRGVFVPTVTIWALRQVGQTPEGEPIAPPTESHIPIIAWVDGEKESMENIENIENKLLYDKTTNGANEAEESNGTEKTQQSGGASEGEDGTGAEWIE